MAANEPAATVVEAEAIRDFAIRAFEAVGVPHQDAEVTTDSMLQAALRGEGDHGMRLVAVWVRKIKDGGTNPRTPLEVVREGPATALLDAHHGIGAVAASHAMDMALRKARDAGAAWVGVRDCNSYANAKYYPMLALQHRMIGLTISNAVPILPPHGGLTPKTGTNPLAIAVPAKEEFPVVLDMSTAAVAFERIRVYASHGERIPVGWAIDREGNPLEDPSQVEAGGFLEGGLLLPAGGYKGFGLSLMFNILTGVLLGGAFMEGLNEFAPYDRSERVSFALAAINIDSFMPYDRFVERVDAFVRTMKDCKLAPGVDQIYLPGERGFLRERERRQAGIPLDAPTVEALRTMAQELGIPGIPGKI